MDSALAEVATAANAWPFEEARKLVERLKRTGKQEALFETGYGPSGLPHIGTFGEVARTSMVRHAFRVLTGDAIPSGPGRRGAPCSCAPPRRRCRICGRPEGP